MAPKAKEDVVPAASSDPIALMDAVNAIASALALLNKQERMRVLASVAMLFGIEEQTRYNNDD